MLRNGVDGSVVYVQFQVPCVLRCKQLCVLGFHSPYWKILSTSVSSHSSCSRCSCRELIESTIHIHIYTWWFRERLITTSIDGIIREFISCILFHTFIIISWSNWMALSIIASTPSSDQKMELRSSSTAVSATTLYIFSVKWTASQNIYFVRSEHVLKSLHEFPNSYVPVPQHAFKVSVIPVIIICSHIIHS